MSAFSQQPREPPGEQKRTESVHAPGLFELFWVDIDNFLPFIEQHRSVVDEDVEASDFFLDKACDGLDRFRIGSVEDMCQRLRPDLLRRFGCCVGVAARDDHAISALRELTRNLMTDPAARSGDQRYVAHFV